MKFTTIASTAAVLAAGTGAALAGGLDRSTFSPSILFEDGTYAEIAYGITSPKVSDSLTGSDVAESFSTVKLGFKTDVSDKITLAFTFNNQPIGADINYAGTPLGAGLFNPVGLIDATAVTFLGKYQFNDNFSAYGGLKYQRVSANADLSIVGRSQGFPAGVVAAISPATFESEEELGYIAGIAYEKKEIALRVSLTYESKIEYDLNSLNAAGSSVGNTVAATPETWLLEFQSGIAENTIVFGGIRHAIWSEANIVVPYGPASVPLTSFNDITTYSLGIGRKLSDSISASFSLFYEESDGQPVSLFAPTDGLFGGTFGMSYEAPKGIKLTAGISYQKRGEGISAPPSSIPFGNNSVTTFGFKVSKNF